MAKRRAPSILNPPKKLARSQPDALKDAQSAREQAEPYRLATVRFPIDALSYSWHQGSNRPLDLAHVQRLCQIFRDQGVQPNAVENHLRLACSRQHVQRMFDHLQSQDQPIEGASSLIEGPVPWPSFRDWSLHIQEKPELMAGQHRVEAFKKYRQQIGGEWVCDIYDIGIFLFPPALLPLTFM
jgi:hypothetical protein